MDLEGPMDRNRRKGAALLAAVALAAANGCAQGRVEGRESVLPEGPRPAGPEPAPERTPWHEPQPERTPQTESGRRVVETLSAIEAGLVSTRYQHTTRVDEKAGLYAWDCSGMADWVLRKASPGARRAIRAERPLARDFYRVLAAAPADRARRGFRRIDRPEEIAPGDLFAWLKPEMFRERKNTGHVGFVVGTPQPHPEHVGVWVMRVADATRILHEDDSRPVGGEGGFGTATMAFLFHAAGPPMAYGWYGAGQHPRTFVPTTIVFGRLEP